MQFEFLIQLTNNHSDFRLQKDGSFRKLHAPAITEEDQLFHTTNAVTSFQQTEKEIMVEGKRYSVYTSTIAILGETSSLYYDIILRRRNFPLVPSKEQLQSIICQGDDRIANSLILNIYGLFELRYYETLDLRIKDPSIVVRHETYDSGNDFVGKLAAVEHSFIDDVYVDMLYYWLEHLKTGKLNYYADVWQGMTEAEIQADLQILELTFGIFHE